MDSRLSLQEIPATSCLESALNSRSLSLGTRVKILGITLVNLATMVSIEVSHSFIMHIEFMVKK
jgi:hypothetical protein